MKKWKDAASVIIAVSNSPSYTNASVYSCLDKDYRELPKEKPDFQILALKKSSESPMLPGRYVFPGGTVNAADGSNDWIHVFTKVGYCVDSLCKLLNNRNCKLPLLCDTSNLLPGCISLRITAIREAFEESGILLCKKSTGSSIFTEPNLSPINAEHLTINEIDTWRAKVLKNPHEFLNLCLYNDCYPDVTSLYLWSNWLTPSNIPVRFDSIFFIAFLSIPPKATEDHYEIESLKLISPIDLLLEFYNGKSVLHFPQLYETARLARFSSFFDLAKFAVKLNGSPSETWMPVRLYAKDGEMSLLPGDELYPKHLDFITPYFIMDDTKSVESFKCHTMHRMMVYDNNPYFIKIFISNLDESSLLHILPLCPDDPVDLKGHL